MTVISVMTRDSTCAAILKRMTAFFYLWNFHR
jgi:hypothetical protein